MYAGSNELSAQDDKPSVSLILEMSASEHSRGDLVACSHKSAIKGFVQKLLSSALSDLGLPNSAKTESKDMFED
jgi:hypothetical protein